MSDLEQTSPKWSSTTKLLVGLTIIALIAALLVQFRTIIGPLILAFMLAYILHPVVARISTYTRISWRWVVNLIYLLLVILLGTSFTLTGLAVAQQLQNLIGFVQRNVTNLPAIAADLSKQVYTFGPFEINFNQFDIQPLLNQLLAAVQPILGRATSLISTFATSAAATLGWGFFVLIISYFLLADASKMSGDFVHIEIPGYTSDVRRLGQELKNVWNAYLRGQLIIILMVMASYSILMVILGMRFALGIAILAGLARFVPYLGPLTLWIVTALVAYFQGGNYFGLEPFYYAILVVGSAMVIDQIFDNLISPRLLGQTLGVHPAAVLVAAIIAANLIGIIGLVLAAPVLATLNLVGGYVVRKMFDLEPWPDTLTTPKPVQLPWSRSLDRLKAWLRLMRQRIS
jgi:predicted PurR-regulated permease PerM